MSTALPMVALGGIRKTGLLALGFLLSTVTAGRGLAQGPGSGKESSPSEWKKAYEVALARWQGAMAGKPYTMTELRSCFCMGDGIRPAKLSVDASGNLVSGQFADEPKGAVPADLLKYNFKSVAQLFANIERAINRPAAAVQVDYDPTLGFPTSLYIDLDAMIADEEDSYTIRDLKITA